MVPAYKVRPYPIRALDLTYRTRIKPSQMRLYSGPTLKSEIMRQDAGTPHDPCKCDGSNAATRMLVDAGHPVVGTAYTSTRAYALMKNGTVLVMRAVSKVADVLDNPRDRRRSKTVGLPIRLQPITPAHGPGGGRKHEPVVKPQGKIAQRGIRNRGGAAYRINFVLAMERAEKAAGVRAKRAAKQK